MRPAITTHFRHDHTRNVSIASLPTKSQNIQLFPRVARKKSPESPRPSSRTSLSLLCFGGFVRRFYRNPRGRILHEWLPSHGAGTFHFLFFGIFIFYDYFPTRVRFLSLFLFGWRANRLANLGSQQKEMTRPGVYRGEEEAVGGQIYKNPAVLDFLSPWASTCSFSFSAPVSSLASRWAPPLLNLIPHSTRRRFDETAGRSDGRT